MACLCIFYFELLHHVQGPERLPVYMLTTTLFNDITIVKHIDVACICHGESGDQVVMHMYEIDLECRRQGYPPSRYVSV